MIIIKLEIAHVDVKGFDPVDTRGVWVIILV